MPFSSATTIVVRWVVSATPAIAPASAAGLRPQQAARLADRGPPDLRILLGPARLRRHVRLDRHAAHRDESPGWVELDRADALRPDVDRERVVRHAPMVPERGRLSTGARGSRATLDSGSGSGPRRGDRRILARVASISSTNSSSARADASGPRAPGCAGSPRSPSAARTRVSPAISSASNGSPSHAQSTVRSFGSIEKVTP